MVPEPSGQGPPEPDGPPSPDYRRALADLDNAELLQALDLAPLELGKRLYRNAHVGPELLQMADEGLVLEVRVRARLGQAVSSAQHAGSHLQIVGVEEWRPTSTRTAWNTEPRLGMEGEGQDG